MNTSVATLGLLSIVEQHCLLAEQARIQANESLTTLPVIFESAGNVGDRGPVLPEGGYSNEFWGVSASSVRRFRIVSSVIELGYDEGFDLLSIRTVVNNADKAKNVTLADIRGAIALCDSAEQAVDAIQALIDGVTAETEAPADSVDADETETAETEAIEVDKILRWLQAPAGSLGKVLEAVQNGHIFTDEQRSAFDEILSIATRIAGAQAFVPAPVAVNA